MLASDVQRFNYAVSLAQKGDNTNAHAILSHLETLYPTNSNLLLWLAYTSSDNNFARIYIDKVTQLDPTNPALDGAKSWLGISSAPSAPSALPQTGFSTPTGVYSNGNSTTQTEQSTFAPPINPAAPASSPLNQFHLPEETKERGVFRLTAAVILGVVGGIILLGVLVVVLLLLLQPDAVTKPADVDTIKAKGLPVYPGARLLALDLKTRREFVAGFNNNITDYKDFAFEFYAVKRADSQKIAPFYSAELKKLNWSVYQENIRAGAIGASSFIKEKQAFILLSIQLSQQEFIRGGITNIQPDELLLVAGTYSQT
jgi:hypothetical protein